MPHKWIDNLPVFSLSVHPAGKKNKLRVYYLSWLRNKILHNDPEVEKKQGWVNVGDLEGCVHYKVGMFHVTAPCPERHRIYCDGSPSHSSEVRED